MDNDFPLRAKNLFIGYEGKRAIPIAGPLEFSISKGKLYGLIGINGIGKSTLIKTLSGLLTPLEGLVLIDDENIFNLSNQERAKHISLVLTDRINSGLATIEEIVKMGRYPYTNWQFGISITDQEIIETAIEAVGIQDKRHHLFSKLSDGNKQKVMIAKALAQDTPIMILDEPTVHLDIKNRFIILDLLHNLTQNHQKTIVFSGHDLDYMLKFCDKMMLMTPDNLAIESPTTFINSGAISKAFDLDLNKMENIHF